MTAHTSARQPDRWGRGAPPDVSGPVGGAGRGPAFRLPAAVDSSKPPRRAHHGIARRKSAVSMNDTEAVLESAQIDVKTSAQPRCYGGLPQSFAINSGKAADLGSDHAPGVTQVLHTRPRRSTDVPASCALHRGPLVELADRRNRNGERDKMGRAVPPAVRARARARTCPRCRAAPGQKCAPDRAGRCQLHSDRIHAAHLSLQPLPPRRILPPEEDRVLMEWDPGRADTPVLS